MRIQSDWEAQLPNDRDHYQKSPVAKWIGSNGAFSPDRFMTRTFNRKMKMKDTFTQIFPSYPHKKETCFTKAVSHEKYPVYVETLEQKPIVDIDRRYTHKRDPIKEYSEEMYKLGSFAP